MFKTLFLVVFLMMNYFDSCGDYSPTSSSKRDDSYIHSDPSPHVSKCLFGFVSDSLTGQYLDSVRVCIKGSAGARCNVVRDHQYGLGIPSGGEYELTATRNGYIKKTIMINLPSEGAVRRDIKMVPE